MEHKTSNESACRPRRKSCQLFPSPSGKAGSFSYGAEKAISCWKVGLPSAMIRGRRDAPTHCSILRPERIAMKWYTALVALAFLSLRLEAPPVQLESPFAHGEAIDLDRVVPANERGILCLAVGDK